MRFDYSPVRSVTLLLWHLVQHSRKWISKVNFDPHRLPPRGASKHQISILPLRGGTMGFEGFPRSDRNPSSQGTWFLPAPLEPSVLRVKVSYCPFANYSLLFHFSLLGRFWRKAIILSLKFMSRRLLLDWYDTDNLSDGYLRFLLILDHLSRFCTCWGHVVSRRVNPNGRCFLPCP